MNNLQVFKNDQFGEIRTVEIGGEPWFVGKDVADRLGYSNPRDALSAHVDEDDKNTVAIHDGIRGNPNQTVINESGLYSLVLSSKLPTAKQFKRWVTAEKKATAAIGARKLMIEGKSLLEREVIESFEASSVIEPNPTINIIIYGWEVGKYWMMNEVGKDGKSE